MKAGEFDTGVEAFDEGEKYPEDTVEVAPLAPPTSPPLPPEVSKVLVNCVVYSDEYTKVDEGLPLPDAPPLPEDPPPLEEPEVSVTL